MKKRLGAFLLTLALLLPLLPRMTLPAKAADEVVTFSSGAILLDSSYSGKNVVIQNGVFSVTVSGATDVNIIFEGVTIDRRYTSEVTNGITGTTVENLYNVSSTLNWMSGTSYTAPTCPFLITGNSSVTAGFRGTCTFYAGTNGCTVSSAGIYTAAATGAGFAGIQVDSGSSLTIEYAENLTVYGAHQLSSPGASELGDTDYSDTLRANVDISYTDDDGNTVTIYDNPSGWGQYKSPANTTTNVTGGGAGIGGGAAYNTSTSSATDYTAGTPGTIIINGGKIEAFGGHQAAGIGGGLNGAATTSKIVINNGTVTAHGGRWAAGIGDGDSAPDASASLLSSAASQIEINGGTVTSYGGVASPGIGCSDKITSSMEISINGGTVNAFSGFPDGFNGTYPSNAPAAIGAGSGSTMASNSIYVSSAATLTCAAFGNYSLTENGVDADTVPTINVDSDGYLLLLRTAEYYSTAERKLVLYKAQYEENTNTGRSCVKYTLQSTGAVYYLDPEWGVVYDEDFTELAAADVPENLTLYVDENSEVITSVELAYYFRSIALTLPNPAVYGGLYALTVPVKGIIHDDAVIPENSDHIILTVEAQNQGTQSGQIDYPSGNNMAMDITSSQFIDLDTYQTESYDPSGNGLIGDKFLPAVYSYSVYVESDAQFAMLYAAFETRSDTDYQIYLDDSLIFDSYGDGTTQTISQKIDLSGVSQKTVRLKKVDNGSTIGAIVYKITFLKKSVYNLQLSDPSKVYDGTPAQATVSGAYTGDLYSIVNVPGSNSGVSGQTVTPASLGPYSSTLYCASSGKGGNKTYYLVDLNMTVSVSAADGQPNALQYVVTVDASQNSSSGTVTITNPNGYAMGWTVTYDESAKTKAVERLTAAPSGYENMTWLTETGQTIASFQIDRTTYRVTLSPAAEGKLIVKSATDTEYTLLNLGDAELDVNFSGDSSSEENAYAQAQAAAAAGTASGQFEYESSSDYTWTQKLTIGTLSSTKSGNSYTTYSSSTDTSLTNAYTRTQSGYYEIVSGSETYQSISLPQEDLDKTVLTYYPQSGTDGDGNPVFAATGTTTPPTDAGTYKVTAQLSAESYTASGSMIFTIEKRTLTVLQIENWLVYVTGDEAKALSAPWTITDPGAITLNNVVTGDDVSVTATTAVYNEVSVSFSSDKITLTGLTLSGADVDNYVIADTQRVFGQIAYNMQGAIFRKTLEGLWRKYYPVDASDPVDESTADYHSPVSADGLYVSHVEYVKARAVNDGSKTARYSVDIEYGAMQFTYYHQTWDVDQMIYVDQMDSHWTGMDGSNNKLTVINYSNRPVYYRMDPVINFLYADISGTGTGITADIHDENGSAVSADTWSEIASATAGNSSQVGIASFSSRYLILSGVPQMSESPDYTTVGTVSITFSPSAGGS